MVEWWVFTGSTMLYNPFNFQSNDNWDTDGLYWYNEFYPKKPVWTNLNQFHGLQKTSHRWSGLVPEISGSVLDWLQSMVACFGGKKLDWTGLANTSWDPCILAVLPPALAAEFPAHLTHHSRISNVLFSWMRSCFQCRMGSKQSSDAVWTQHLLNHDHLHLQYLQHLALHKSLLDSWTGRKYEAFLLFDDAGPRGNAHRSPISLLGRNRNWCIQPISSNYEIKYSSNHKIWLVQNCGACLKDRWALIPLLRPSVLQAGTTVGTYNPFLQIIKIKYSSNHKIQPVQNCGTCSPFLQVMKIKYSSNNKIWAVRNCSACLKDKWALIPLLHPSVLQADRKSVV